jgi:DNA-binding SARP family transcriptional activator/tetratricopeptide (TPR) repeat protein
MGAPVEFGILGPVELIENGRSVPLGPAKQRGMLAILLYYAGQSVRAETLIDLLWYPRGDADHRPTLYSLASRLRAVLAQVGLENRLVRVPGVGAYRLDVDPLVVDIHRYRRQLTEARTAFERGRPDLGAELLVNALLLRRGEPLAELRGPRADHLRDALDQLHLDSNRLLAECWLACGRPHSALDRLENLVPAHQLDEGLARCWILALHAVGRHDEARRFAAGFRRRFRKHMHVEPDIDSAVGHGRTASGRPTIERVPRQLPSDISDFTGRESLLAELDELSGRNVVVITGMPGVGKTTLAKHWAHQQRDRFADGQLYLDAGAYGPSAPIDPEDGLDRFLRTLGVPSDQLPGSPEQRRERFEELIGERRILIFIDNALSADQVRPLIPRSMNCLTVITSRVRLSSLSIRDGVCTVVAGPFAEPESESLLARIIGVRAAGDPEGLSALARLSGGVPLAIRIIAERAAVRPGASLGELAEELRHRLLDADDTDDQAVSLTTLFAWSYNALRPEAADVFRRIALHPGASIGPEAAAAIVDVPVPEAEKLLETLAKAHMIRHDVGRRYGFHSLLRRFAIERAAGVDSPADADRDRRRLLDWYLLSAANAVAVIAPEWPPVPDLPVAEGADPLSFPNDVEAMRWCDDERDNLFALSAWADQQGHHRHGWQLPGVLHEVFERYGFPGDVLRLNQQALEAARKDGHEIGQIGTLTNLGTTYFALHDYDHAVAAFVAAQEFAAASGHIEEETICLHNLAATYVRLGEIGRAIEIFEDALLICRKIANSAGEAATLNWLGEAYLRSADYQRSAECLRQALAIRERIGAHRGTGQSHSSLGALHLAAGRPQSALRHCESALTIHLQTHDQRAECDTLITLAEIQCRLATYADAVHSGRRAVLLSEQMSDSYRWVEALTALCRALIATGELESAAHQIEAASQMLDGLSGVQVRTLREGVSAVRRAIGLAIAG